MKDMLLDNIQMKFIKKSSRSETVLLERASFGQERSGDENCTELALRYSTYPSSSFLPVTIKNSSDQWILPLRLSGRCFYTSFFPLFSNIHWKDNRAQKDRFSFFSAPRYLCAVPFITFCEAAIRKNLDQDFCEISFGWFLLLLSNPFGGNWTASNQYISLLFSWISAMCEKTLISRLDWIKVTMKAGCDGTVTRKKSLRGLQRLGLNSLALFDIGMKSKLQKLTEDKQSTAVWVVCKYAINHAIG